MLNKDALELLNNLVQISEDGKKGFSEAVDKAVKSELKIIFQRRLADCGSAVIELQRLVESIGGTAKDGGTVAGAARRGWPTLKAAVGDTDIALLEEIERAEDEAKAAYEKALIVELPQQIRNVVRRQHAATVCNHDLIRDLRDSYKAAKESLSV